MCHLKRKSSRSEIVEMGQKICQKFLELLESIPFLRFLKLEDKDTILKLFDFVFSFKNS